MITSIKHQRWLLAAVAFIVTFLYVQTDNFAQTATMPCTDSFYISHTFTNGAMWEMCYDERLNEGIVYHDIYYTTAHGLRRKVLGQMNLAQIHVPYDDNSNRYHDISDFGLGGETSSGSKKLLAISGAECENGLLYQNSEGRNVICKQEDRHGYAWKDYVDYGLAESMTIFSVSRIQRYYYISEYEFHDNGMIAPSVAATGRIQAYIYSNSTSFENPEEYGWHIYQISPAGFDTDVYGTNHIHTYWWRLDFDLGGAPNDVFEEIEFVPDGNGLRRRAVATTFITETARTNSAETFRTWRVKDTEILNEDGHNISYQIEPNGKNIFRGPEGEEFSHHDIYATTGYACERFISHNTAVAGCDDSVDEFTNGEELDDTVVWYGATFHHLVRDEDNSRMTPHKEGFHLVPRDWTADNPVDMERLPDAPPAALRFSEMAEGRPAPMEGLNSSLFLVAISFMFVVGTVIARRKTR